MSKIKRVAYKSPSNVFFRRCWLVKEVSEAANGDVFVTHGLRGRLRTKIPAGHVVRYVHRRK